MAWHPEFERAFNPQAIAVVGASRADPEARRPGSGGGNFIPGLKDLGFRGRIYPVNPNAEEILGLRCYPNLRSLPEPVDLVMISVARQVVPQVLEECIATNSKNVHLYTAGFEETGTEEGIRLGKVVREIAQQGGLRMLGPNCMGITYVPRTGVTVSAGHSPIGGNVGFVSQSGGHAGSFSRYCPSVGVHCSKVVSIGNAYVFDGADLLEYFATDPETDIICMYLEGIGDGRRLRELVEETNPRKPVIIWKGGLTTDGSRAAASHTASLAGQETVWDAFYQQTGAIRAESIEEMAEVTLALQLLGNPPGRRGVIIVGGGGNSVAAADAFAREGLSVPPLGSTTREALSTLLREAGTSVRNPIDDSGALFNNVPDLEQGLKAIFADPEADFVIPILNIGGSTPTTAQTLQGVVDCLCDLAQKGDLVKPVIPVLSTLAAEPASVEQLNAARNKLLASKIPAFPSLPRAARALSRYMSYHEYQAELAGEALASARER